ncbi:hypothetical protein DSO57_1004938 [Entomophthora muscae]|uniref:Uncharacterized protein n=1 Tax=Entomophthora muscae TaxID=34485 RepID=A0ACC2T852_9FUNG|nr:hypothetical protein DSO57_1004938 [Entomophthora muscae]
MQSESNVSESWLRRADRVLASRWSKISPKCCTPLASNLTRAKTFSPSGSFNLRRHTILTSTSCNGLTSDDACLKHARQRIQLAKDFDHMLENGFPRLTDKHPDPPEYTIYISLTPNIVALNQ